MLMESMNEVECDVTEDRRVIMAEYFISAMDRAEEVEVLKDSKHPQRIKNSDITYFGWRDLWANGIAQLYFSHADVAKFRRETIETTTSQVSINGHRISLSAVKKECVECVRQWIEAAYQNHAK